MNESEIIRALEAQGHKASGSRCACTVQGAAPNAARDGTGVQQVHFCGRYFNSNGTLRAQPNIDPSWALQPHMDHLFGLPAFGSSGAAASPALSHLSGRDAPPVGG